MNNINSLNNSDKNEWLCFAVVLSFSELTVIAASFFIPFTFFLLFYAIQMQSTFYNANKNVDLFILYRADRQNKRILRAIACVIFPLFSFRPCGWSAFDFFFFLHFWAVWKTKSHIETNVDGLNWSLNTNYRYIPLPVLFWNWSEKRRTIYFINVLISDEKHQNWSMMEPSSCCLFIPNLVLMYALKC